MFQLVSYNHLHGAALTQKYMWSKIFKYMYILRISMLSEVGCNKRAETCWSGLLYMWMKFFIQFVGNKTFICICCA